MFRLPDFLTGENIICNGLKLFQTRQPLYYFFYILWNFMKSNAIFIKFHTRLQNTDFVLVLVPIKFWFTRTRTKRIRLDCMHKPCASTLYPIPCSLYESTLPEFLFRLGWPLFRPVAVLVWNFMKSDAVFKKYLTGRARGDHRDYL
jgi:hypothetical protein